MVQQLEHLWNGWRNAYVTGALDRQDSRDGSVFTAILRSGLNDEVTNIVHRGTACFAILNAFPYTTGHLLVLPYREVADLSGLNRAEHDELWTTVTTAVDVITAAFRPGGVNVGINLGAAAGGSVDDHLHVHVLPRWPGDANFMTAVANTRTLPEALVDTAARIRAAWPRPRGDADQQGEP